jgi:thioredoxin reductase (NADPH)
VRPRRDGSGPANQTSGWSPETADMKRPSAVDTLDCLVIGAGPAGLTAAIYLGRFKRRFIVVHDGRSRASWIPRTHNHPGFARGITGPDLLQRTRRHAERYGAHLVEAEVTAIERQPDGFRVTLDGRRQSTRTVLLATGVADRMPDLAGVEDAVRTGLMRICPICDAFEAAGQVLGVIGRDDMGAREAMFLRDYSERVSLIHVAAPSSLSSTARVELRQADVEVLESPLQSIDLDPQKRAAVCFEAHGVKQYDALYSALGVLPRNELALQAGAHVSADQRLVVDAHQQTTVPGLYAAGDLVRGLNQIATAQGEAAIAATAIHNHLRGSSAAG